MPSTVLHSEKYNNRIGPPGPYSALRKGGINYKNIQLQMVMSTCKEKTRTYENKQWGNLI